MASTPTGSDPQALAELRTRIGKANLDFIRFTWADIHGQSRGKTVPARNAHKFLHEGVGAYAGINAMGPRSEFVPHIEVLAINLDNFSALPDPESFRVLPWAGVGKYRVGELQCETRWIKENTPQQACPRFIARQQLSQLGAMGYRLLSTWEQEFQLFTMGPASEPVFDGIDIFNNFLVEQHGSFLYDLDKMLLGAGINVETLQTEYADGQFEVTLEPIIGIRAADNAFVFRDAVREIAYKKNYNAVFMSKTLPAVAGNGAHFNHSLWDMKLGRNIFHHPGSEDGLSEAAHHWIGGLMKHAAALTALCSPTVNCYRRLHNPWAADYVDWGMGDRMASVRAKVGGTKGTYLENRICSGLSNPYLALAATVAAGIDGIKKKIQPPPAGQKEGKLPLCLSEALDALEKNDVLTSALGPEFVRWFLKSKRDIDLVHLKDSDITNPTEEALKKERDLYKYC